MPREYEAAFLGSRFSQMSRTGTGRDVSFNGGSFSGNRKSRTLPNRDEMSDGPSGASKGGTGASAWNVNGVTGASARDVFLPTWGSKSWIVMILLVDPVSAFSIRSRSADL